MQICVDQKAKVDASILEFEKKKIRVSQLEYEFSMLQDTIKRMQEGGEVVLYPQPILYDIGCKFNLGDGKFTLCDNECHVCVQWFPYKDIIVTSCGHTYHPFRIKHTILILMHVARLMIVKKHGTQIGYCPWGFGHQVKML
jgi:hypothetical protein